jgi:hypothetical protein
MTSGVSSAAGTTEAQAVTVVPRFLETTFSPCSFSTRKRFETVPYRVNGAVCGSSKASGRSEMRLESWQTRGGDRGAASASGC